MYEHAAYYALSSLRPPGRDTIVPVSLLIKVFKIQDGREGGGGGEPGSAYAFRRRSSQARPSHPRFRQPQQKWLFLQDDVPALPCLFAPDQASLPP